MKATLTEFQRAFRKARAAADAGESVVITDQAGNPAYLFFRQTAAAANPFAGLEKVFGAVRLGADQRSPREQIRARLGKKYRR
jgi:uncharacterized protein GlcG (DUF336 family)